MWIGWPEIFIATLTWICFTHGQEPRRTSYLLQFTEQPQDTRAPEKGTAVLQCHASSFVPHVSYKWFVNDTEIPIDSSSSKYVIQGNHGNLLIGNLQRGADEGGYRCLATNSYGSIISVEATLRIAYMYLVSLPPNDTVMALGSQSLLIPAPRYHSYPEPFITWFRENDKRAITDGLSNGKFFISPNGDLSIIGAQSRDSGNYTVSIRNGVSGGTIKYTVVLEVNETKHPDAGIFWLIRPRNTTVQEGTVTVTLECVVSYDIIGGYPIPPSLIWYKDGIAIKKNSKYGYLAGSFKQRLFIRSVARDDGGVYKCKASNFKVTLEASVVLTVTRAQEKTPVFSEKLAPKLTEEVGEDIDIDLPLVTSSQITWLKDAVPIATLNDSRISVSGVGGLTVRNARMSDAGLYQVLASTSGGEATIPPIYLDIEDDSIPTPSRPPKPTGNPITSSPSTQIEPSMPVTTTNQYATSSTENLSLTSTAVPSTATSQLAVTSPEFSAMTSNAVTPATSAVIATAASSSVITATPTSSSAPLSTTMLPPSNPTTPNLTWPGIGTEPTPTRKPAASEALPPNRKQTNQGGVPMMWIYVAAGAAGLLVIVIICALLIKRRRKRGRSRSLQRSDETYEEFEMKKVKRNGKSKANGTSGGARHSPSCQSKVDRDKNLLLHEPDNEALYAPVQALDNMSSLLVVSKVKHAQTNLGHEYEEPIKKPAGKRYSKPLPIVPSEMHAEPRPPSCHSYLELLGPDEQLDQVYSEAGEGQVNLGFNGGAVYAGEDIYDSAQEGQVTKTFRSLTRLSQAQNEDDNQVRKLSNTACADSTTPLHETAGSEVVAGVLEPLYQVLEGPDKDDHNAGDRIYEYDVAESTIKQRPESMYQPLLGHQRKTFNQNEGLNEFKGETVYQPLKTRSVSAPSLVLLRRATESGSLKSTSCDVIIDDKRNSRALTDPERLSGNYDDEGVYQPLNNSSERCPLNASKPQSDSTPSKRLSNSSYYQPSPTLSHKSFHEPTYHAVNVSPSGSMRKRAASGSNKSYVTQSRSRDNSDLTHSIVNIAAAKRAATTEDLVRHQTMPRFHRRNLSDAGLCTVNLSQLHVTVDVDAGNKNNKMNHNYDNYDNNDGMYMPLVKATENAGAKDNIYSPLEDSRRESRVNKQDRGGENIYHDLQTTQDQGINGQTSREGDIYQEIIK